MNILITGGHSGMGLELSKMVLDRGYKLGLIVRSESRKKDAERLFTGENLPDMFVADLGKRNEIESVAGAISKKWDKLDGLFNNAGVLLDKLYTSDYGNELQLEINAISPYLLTKALKPLLDKAESPFIVNTVTSGLDKKKTIDISSFKQPEKFTKLTGSYVDSKLTFLLLMNNLSKDWDNARIVNVDPGAIKTKMTAGDGMPFWLKPIRNLFFKSPQEGAKRLYEAAFEKYLSDSGIYVSSGKIRSLDMEISEAEIKELLS
ncbi:MAG: SDR family NAD(P)-dependent oxidoreductase [Bacteroidota bacterium]